jgi:anti-sigma factor (TIGR02949 family)
VSQTDRMTPCSEAVRRMWDFLDRSLSARDAAAVENHLAFCRRCCGELEFAKEIRAFLRSHEVEEMPPDVRSRLEAFLEEL